MKKYAEYKANFVATSDWTNHKDASQVKRVVEAALKGLGLDVCQSEVLVEGVEDEEEVEECWLCKGEQMVKNMLDDVHPCPVCVKEEEDK